MTLIFAPSDHPELYSEIGRSANEVFIIDIKRARSVTDVGLEFLIDLCPIFTRASQRLPAETRLT